MNQYKIAEILHNAISAIPRTDGSVIVPWDALNSVLKDRAADTVRRLMDRMGGDDFVIRCGIPDRELHDIWHANMIDMGWYYGPTYSFEQKLHPSMVPFDELPDDEKIKDAIWSGIIYALYPYYEEETL